MATAAPRHQRPTGTAARGGQPVRDGRLPISELLYDRAGAASPFGDDQTFPLPVTSLVYQHPGKAVNEG
jgi:hypothetical protein